MNDYLLGLLFGIVFALGAFLIAKLIRRKRHPGGCKYDERQMVGRGKAFQAGFFTLLVAGVICNAWDYVSPLPGGSFPWNIGAMLLGVAVFAITAIHFDAYVAMNDSPRRFLTTGGFFIIAMAMMGLVNFRSDQPEGRMMGLLNLGVGFVWVIVVAALLLHRRGAKKEEE